MTQDNVVKKPAFMGVPDNLAGNESGQSTTAGLGTVAGKSSAYTEYVISDASKTNSMREAYVNIAFEPTDQRSPRSKGSERQDVPEAGRNQYQ